MIGRMNFLKYAVLLSLMLLLGTSTALAQSSSFTYQGRLQDGGTNANGSYDFQFTLWDTLSAGTQQPQLSPVTVTLNAIAVANGTFSVQLDFGASAFPGAARFLETRVRPNGGSGFTILEPRQPITSTPYAVRSSSSAAADTATTATNATQLGAVAANQYVLTGDARLTDSRAPTAGSASYIQNTTSPQTSSNFNISGNGTAGGTLSAGTVNAATQFNLGGTRILTNVGVDNLFAGDGAGQANTDGVANTFFGPHAGEKNTTGEVNVFVGVDAGANNTTGHHNAFSGADAGLNNTTGFSNTFIGSGAGYFTSQGSKNVIVGQGAGVSNTSGDLNAFFGYFAGNLTIGNRNTFLGGLAGSRNFTGSGNTFIGYNATANTGITNATALGADSSVTAGNSLVLGSVKDVNGAASDTNVGIGTTAPLTRLHIKADTSQADLLKLETTSPTTHSFRIGPGSGGNFFGIYDDQAGAVRLAIDYPSGNVGIGNSAPSFKLHVNGEVRANTLSIDAYPNNSGGPALCVSTTNNRIGLCSSSLRYKTSVRPFVGGLNVVTRLRPISFTWKEGGMHDVGLAAEEVDRVEPLLAFRNNKGEIEGVRYAQLSAVFINAFKEQQAQIEQQQEELKQQSQLIKRQQDQAKQQRTALETQRQQLEALKSLVCRSHRRATMCK